jgi:hypothetical protein
MGTLAQIAELPRARRLLRAVRSRRNVVAADLGIGLEELTTNLGIVETSLMDRSEIAGAIWLDSEPVMFDDLIEVRTGGDVAIGLVLEEPFDTFGEGGVDALYVAMFPLRRTMTDSFLDDQLRPLLDGVESEPHVLVLAPGSPIEERITMDWGYRPVSRYGPYVRRYCPDRFWARLREDILRPQTRVDRVNASTTDSYVLNLPHFPTDTVATTMAVGGTTARYETDDLRLSRASSNSHLDFDAAIDDSEDDDSFYPEDDDDYTEDDE